MDMQRFISFEGGEGCGKTTQIALLAQALQRASLPVIITREPGGEEGAEAIRRLLVEGAADRWDPVAETLLFLAARVQHSVRTIQPALTAGQFVLTDRFHDSTRVYQGIGKGMSDAFYQNLHQATLGEFIPAMTLLLDIAPEAGLSRSLKRENTETRFESMELAFHQKVRDGFLALAGSESSRFVVIDASQPKEAVHAAIITAVNARYGLDLASAAD